MSMSSDATSDNAFTGQTVKAVRKALRVTQADLAHRMDISQPYLSQLEDGLRTWSVQMVGLVADRLGVDPANLVRRTQGRRTDAKAS